MRGPLGKRGGAAYKAKKSANFFVKKIREYFRLSDRGKGFFVAVLRIRILFDPWIRDPGWVKKQDPDPRSGSGMINTDHISESLETNFLG